MRHTAILFLSLFLISIFQVGCSKGSSPTNANQSLMGTGDGAGGNGTQNKVYEAYSIDPLEEQAYKEKLAPLLAKMNQLYHDPSLAEDEQMSFEAFFYLHTWYVLDMNLSPIDKKVLGITFTSDKSQQLAVQTDKEVWIDAKAYNKISNSDKSALLLHELVMSLYLLKFKGLKDYCNDQNVTVDPGGCDNAEQIDELTSVEEPKPLEEQDYKNVRQMTTYLLMAAQKGDFSQLKEMFQTLQFGRMFWDTKIVSADPTARAPGKLEQSGNASNGGSSVVPAPAKQTVELSNSDLVELIEAARLTHHELENCRSGYLGIEFLCRFNYANTYAELLGSNVPDYTFSIQKTENESFTSPVSGQFMTTYLSEINDPSFKRTYYSGMVQISRISNHNQGEIVRALFVIIRKDVAITGSETLKIAAVISVPFVVTSVDKSTGSCKSINPKAKVLAEDIIVAYETDFPQKYFAALFKNMKLSICL